MGGSADPEAPTPSPSPSPAKASPPSTGTKRPRRSVQTKLSWGLVKPACGGGGAGAGGGGGAGGAGGEPGPVPPAPAAEERAEKEGAEEPEKGKNRGRARKSPGGRKPCSNKGTTGLDPTTKDEIILVDESPQKKQRKARKQDAALPNKKRGRVLLSTDEENRKLSSGKKMHPFFASRKMNKCAGQDVLGIEDLQGLCDLGRDPPLYPIHVVYQLEANMPIHWSNWIITDGSCLDTNTANLLQNSVSFFEGLVKPLEIEANCKNLDLNQLIKADNQCMLLASDSSCHPSPSCNKQPERILHGWQEVPRNSCETLYHLWTDKYRPETAAQVCGNSEHVKFLTEWLKGWDERGHKIGAANGDINDSSYQDESDADYSDDASVCDNVLLITGPVGCGKSATVFACARDQGFNVIEVNTSDMRNGAYVRQKFEEATKSHGLEKWSQEDVINPPRDDSLDPALRTPDSTEYQNSLSCAMRTVFDCDQQKSHVGYYSGSNVSDEAPKQVINKTLILFEDVDTVFDEDRGFISTILKMAETTKWPIILTSNRKDPSLPNLLDQLVLDFKYPSSAELLSHVDMICKSEGVEITIPQLKHIIDISLGDIRRTIMLVQFWYQGKRHYAGRPKKCLSGPFDLDAIHSTVPKLVPWEFPCKLSETVYIEIDKTILSAEEKKKQMEVSELEGLCLQVTAPVIKGRSASKTRKTKKSKLKRGCSAECNISPCKNDLDDFHDVPDIPLPPDQQRKKNRHGILLLSESDDDPTDVDTSKDTKFTTTVGCFPQSSEVPHTHGQAISSIFPFPSESRETFGIADSFQNPPESSIAGSISQVCDTFMSQGVSCVPESSFICGGTSASISSDDFLSRAVSNDLSALCNGGTYITSRMVLEDTNNVNNLIAERQKDMEDVVGETSEVYVESFGRNEQASCSTAGYQLMDECSRAESIWLLSAKKANESCKVEQVQDTWNRLRSCCPELPRETCNRAASGALKLASGLSDLISESDVMLSHCCPLTNDILDPSSTPCVEPDDFSWYKNQIEMGSVYAQHALCIFSRKSKDIDDCSVDLSQELLFASKSAMSLGKLISSGLRNNDGAVSTSHVKNPTTCAFKRRERQVHLCETLFPVVPSKLSQSLRGPAFIDYLSSVSQISRLENLRLSESKAINKQRRSRQSIHYLSSGALSLSPEDVVLLAESGCFSDGRQKVMEQAPGSI
ncbi:hypothetical protein ACP70R_016407 [Stipagrostis hirtigluma subsp. patula]